MILAAGLGTRLGALGAATPKILIEVGGRPLLERHLEYLADSGVARAVINVHHHADDVEEFVASYDGPLQVVCIREERLLGTAGGVRNALPELVPGAFLVIYGDILVQEPIRAMLDLHRESAARVTLAVHQADSAEGKGTVDVDPGGRVLRFAEKAGKFASGPALINSGIYVVETSAVEQLEPGRFADFGQHVFPALVAAGERLMAFRLAKPVIDIGTPEGLALADATAASLDRPAAARER
jgi:NDP-sugar pyrophosphorylase family protein